LDFSPFLLSEKTRTDLLAALVATRRLPAPKPEAHWAIADRYAGIEHAQLVVANIRYQRERSAAIAVRREGVKQARAARPEGSLDAPADCFPHSRRFSLRRASSAW
jgi:hypothetical protein